MIALEWVNQKIKERKANGKIKIYVFRITREKTERSKFFGSIGHLNNVWFCNADMCWRCVRELKNTYAANLKWLTPGDDGWEPAIKENPKPSLGTISFWIKEGISQKEYNELEKDGDVTVLERHKIKIR